MLFSLCCFLLVACLTLRTAWRCVHRCVLRRWSRLLNDKKLLFIVTVAFEFNDVLLSGFLRLNQLLLTSLEVEALTADGHVHLTATDKLNTIVTRCAQSKTGNTIANLTNSLQLLDLLTLWNQVQHIVERFSESRATQG